MIIADYRYANGEMRTGMLVCQYQLTDVNEGDGGLGLIPGRYDSCDQCLVARLVALTVTLH